MHSKKIDPILVAGAVLTVLLVLTQTAWTEDGHGRYKLGGSWVGSGPGYVYTTLQTPLNPEASAMAHRSKLLQYNADTAGLIATFGGDSVSDFVGEGKMISRDTCKWTLVGYMQKQGNPPQIMAIWIISGTMQFINPDQGVLKYTNSIYLLSADADNDGLPDPGTTPVLIIPGTDTARRVPN